jgi:hypothetical protein
MHWLFTGCSGLVSCYRLSVLFGIVTLLSSVHPSQHLSTHHPNPINNDTSTTVSALVLTAVNTCLPDCNLPYGLPYSIPSNCRVRRTFLVVMNKCLTTRCPLSLLPSSVTPAFLYGFTVDFFTAILSAILIHPYRGLNWRPHWMAADLSIRYVGSVLLDLPRRIHRCRIYLVGSVVVGSVVVGSVVSDLPLSDLSLSDISLSDLSLSDLSCRIYRV